MTDEKTTYERWIPSRRSVMKTGALITAGSALGLSAPASAQNDTQQALMLDEQWRSGSIFRVVSPPLEDPPQVATSDLIEGRTAQVIEYFNTEEEVFLFLPEDAQPLEEGELYVLSDEFSTPDTGDQYTVAGLLRVQFSPLGQEDFPFDIEEDTDIEFLDGGGEAAVRPRNFFSGALFQITSGPQGWVPEDVADSGFFTNYETHHARYLGTGDTFLFFPQEDAAVSQDQLYLMRDEFEFFDPEGNLVASEFDPVDQESVTINEEFL